MLSNMSTKQFLLYFISVSSVSALYFHIGETEKKCFIEEIPDETMVVGRYISWNIIRSGMKATAELPSRAEKAA